MPTNPTEGSKRPNVAYFLVDNLGMGEPVRSTAVLYAGLRLRASGTKAGQTGRLLACYECYCKAVPPTRIALFALFYGSIAFLT